MIAAPVSRPAWRSEWPWVLAIAIALYVYAPDPNLAPSAVLLWLIWRSTTVPELPPVIPLALTYQWIQVVSGSWYIVLTGRELPAFYVSGIDTTILIGLGSLAALTAGIAIGMRSIRTTLAAGNQAVEAVLTLRLLIAVYLLMLLGEGTIQRLALEIPSLRQALIAVQMARYGVLFLLVRRFSSPHFRIAPLAALLAIELALGFSGFFADFKEPLAIMALVALERFHRRRVSHWATVAGLAILAVALGTIWLGVRGEYRADLQRDTSLGSRSARLERIWELANAWATLERETIANDIDTLVDRVWVQYYPALAMRRVPSALPHSDGQFFSEALIHVLMPRLLYPDKPPLQPDSEKVRYYAGVWVAGAAEGTSIALGYTTEMYIDYGVPRMFLPVFAYGLFMGLAFTFFRRMIFVRELAIPLLTVVFWLSLYLHEESFAKMLGDALTLLAYLGGLTIVIDRFVTGGRLTTADQQHGAAVRSWQASPLPPSRVVAPRQ
jgi:hypothetical protein